MKPLVAKTLEIAAGHIGVREIGRSNRGKEVDRWLRQAGVGLGNPWCAGFTYGNKEDAAEELGVPNPFIRSAYTPDIGNWAKVRSILIPCLQNGKLNPPEAGDDFLVMGPSRFYHTGHVWKVNRNDWISIEGNSNSEGSREGYEVASNHRPYHSRFYWVRWSALCSDEGNQPPTRKLYLGGKFAADLPVRENVTLAPVRRWAKWMGNARVDWVSGSDTPLRYNERPLDVEIIFFKNDAGENVAHVPLRALTALDATLAVSFDSKAQRVDVVRVKQ